MFMGGESWLIDNSKIVDNVVHCCRRVLKAENGKHKIKNKKNLSSWLIDLGHRVGGELMGGESWLIDNTIVFPNA